MADEDEVGEFPIDGCLDLHTFHPRDLPTLIPDYLEECRARGILCVRIVHGKGTGQLRRSVHAILSRLPEVQEFHLAGSTAGAWGATLVYLDPIRQGTVQAGGSEQGRE